ncbi:hypothetical protein METBIDRAFT_179513 [Metschnikowia bicuspidata var. bicuspidata NRRL YB-4993]|uniref:Uncharacterized protein n=1 Tax=Metschnikowia bicuspidata var. bicuspidata NRRL YB-4993 TaxID=869754 RepID=A0A1A0HBM9_9ASCO|nr:hypothetical protein METBIDRAFT_179513 [Metschnikowia bicuspidata var. bicuspidata NRRL YB-4993]OBA21282.1 hypothetical protein METBIDRAFT_179513 [Metschnikowia bicuspidata var. bicuspidata NRRL YB-4993]
MPCMSFLLTLRIGCLASSSHIYWLHYILGVLYSLSHWVYYIRCLIGFTTFAVSLGLLHSLSGCTTSTVSYWSSHIGYLTLENHGLLHVLAIGVFPASAALSCSDSKAHATTTPVCFSNKSESD